MPVTVSGVVLAHQATRPDILTTLFGGLLLLGAVGALLVATFVAGGALAGRTDKAAAFERSYATVPAHVAEFVFWMCRHVKHALRGNVGRLLRLRTATLALAAALVTVFMPVAAIAATGASDVAAHGVAAGVGALVWGLVLESATLRRRTEALAGSTLLRVELWLVALLLCAADAVVVAASALSNFGDANLNAAMIGVSYSAAADLVSTYIGFVLCPWVRYPLTDP